MVHRLCAYENGSVWLLSCLDLNIHILTKWSESTPQVRHVLIILDEYYQNGLKYKELLMNITKRACTYKESFTLNSTPQKGRHLIHRFRHCQTHIGCTPMEQHVSGEKWSKAIKVGVDVKAV